MRFLLIITFSLIMQALTAQHQDTLMERAAEALNQKDYCTAFDHFNIILQDSSKRTPYDYYSGAVSAANCAAEQQALRWLDMALAKGLGLNEEEISYIETDRNLVRLHTHSEWEVFISRMKNAYANHRISEEKKADEWLNSLLKNNISHRNQNNAIEKTDGFALFFTNVDSLSVPYLVYVPSTYEPSQASQVIVFLHGGVVNLDDFQHKSPDIAREPIFAIGERTHSIVVYPFGKKDFGWSKQRKAFENIYTIIDSVESIYNVAPSKIYMGGMSNGGSAVYWFATQKTDTFAGYFAVSALPALPDMEIDFDELASEKPFYSIHAQDDDVVLYDSVRAIYTENKSAAANWHFQTVDTGGHGFIYRPDTGVALLETLTRQLLTK